jgi:hypothetical protein
MIIGRKRPNEERGTKEIQRQITIVERRQSQLQLRSPEKIEASTV